MTEAEKIKSERDLEGCTFKPEILNSKEKRKGKVYLNLNSKAKNYNALEEKRKELEMKYCSFQPKIDAKSDLMVAK